jgi:hypothetical protein
MVSLIIDELFGRKGWELEILEGFNRRAGRGERQRMEDLRLSEYEA